MKIIKVALIVVWMGIFILIGASFAPSEVLPSGMLNEPYFFLVPVGMLFIFIGIIGITVGVISHEIQNKKQLIG